MSEFVFKLPDLGEGTVEAEIVEWHVQPGDVVAVDQIIVDVMTDKANVEVPSPVAGRVLRTSGQPGDVVPVGSELIAFETATGKKETRRASGKAAPAKRTAEADESATERSGEAASEPADAEADGPADETADETVEQPAAKTRATAARAASKAPASEPEAADALAAESDQGTGLPARDATARVITSPAIRKAAQEAGIDLASIRGSGPRGRILRKDYDAYAAAVPATGAASEPRATTRPSTAGEEVKVIGIRRVIANRMTESKRTIPHYAYVEEIDVTALETLRKTLNVRNPDAPSLTVLPFIATALIRALRDYPMCNAHYDAEAGVLRRFAHVHLGIATQTPDGLKVPVVHHAERLALRPLAAAIARVATAARDGTASREQLGGSTITITSLGRLGGIVTTPVINLPEVGIIGVNKAVDRPVVVNGQVVVRTMMNLSSSFDHRFVDGFDAASLIQRIRELLEEPALLFIDD